MQCFGYQIFELQEKRPVPHRKTKKIGNQISNIRLGVKSV